jgi:hypothetical protein
MANALMAEYRKSGIRHTLSRLRPRWRATSIEHTDLTATTGRALPFVQVMQRMPIVRFAVPRHEDGWHALHHPRPRKPVINPQTA